MLDVRPGDLTLLDGVFGTDTQLVTVTWVTPATTSASVPLAKCIGQRGQLASCTHRVRNPATRLLHGERR